MKGAGTTADGFSVKPVDPKCFFEILQTLVILNSGLLDLPVSHCDSVLCVAEVPDPFHSRTFVPLARLVFHRCGSVPDQMTASVPETKVQF